MYLQVVLSHLGLITATATLQLSLSSSNVTGVTVKCVSNVHVCIFIDSKQYMFTFSLLWLNFHESYCLVQEFKADLILFCTIQHLLTERNNHLIFISGTA